MQVYIYGARVLYVRDFVPGDKCQQHCVGSSILSDCARKGEFPELKREWQESQFDKEMNNGGIQRAAHSQLTI